MSLHHLQTPATDPVKAEIAAAKDAIAWLDHVWPQDAEHRERVKCANARLRAAEEQDYETMVSTRDGHLRLQAEYAAIGKQFGVDEHQAGIDRCDAALARLAPVQEMAA